MRSLARASALLGTFVACLSGRANEESHGGGEVFLSVNTDARQGNVSSPLLYGAMFEEMDHSGDGGIHGQLLRNNGFQGSDPDLTAYKPIGDVNLSVDPLRPVSDAINASLQVTVPKDVSGFVGCANTGYAGVPVTNATYQNSFWMMGEYNGTVTVQLVGSSSGDVFVTHNLSVESSEKEFRRFETSFNSTRAAEDGDNEWRLLFDVAVVNGSFLNIGLVELFPPTYKGRANGLRDDVAKFLEASKPTFLRMPGGNNIEGLSIPKRWIWNNTIGPTVDRPGRDGNWFYPNTDALGLDEYMWWCEDMNMTAVLAVWDGKSYGGIVSGPDLKPFVDDIINELEYLLGPPNSTWGSLRAKNGRKDPWPLQYLEIGNEDDFTGGCETYPDRFTQIYNAINSTYPDLNIIISTGVQNCIPSPLPPGVMIDLHYYQSPDPLVGLFNQFDNFPRDRPIIVGEWGCRNTTAERGQFWGFVQGSCAEAVHMIGFERNSDIVKMTAYAPLLQNFAFTQWSPTLFGFSSNPNSLTPSTSYFVQQMFAGNKGTSILPVNSTTGFGPVYWVASRNETTVQLKLANYGADNQTVIANIPDTRSGTLEILAGPQFAGNKPGDVNIVPRRERIVSEGGTGNYTVEMPAWGVAVLAVE